MKIALETLWRDSVEPFVMPPIPGVGSSGGFEFIVQDTLSRPPKEFAETVNAIISKANEAPEISQAYTTFRANIPQIFVNLNREKALQLGVPLSDIFQTLQSLLGSVYVNDFNLYGKVYKVTIQADMKFRKDKLDIKKIYVRNTNGEMIPLSTLCE